LGWKVILKTLCKYLLSWKVILKRLCNYLFVPLGKLFVPLKDLFVPSGKQLRFIEEFIAQTGNLSAHRWIKNVQWWIYIAQAGIL